MGKINARARLIEGLELAIDNKRSHCFIADQPTETFSGLGPTPIELCVMSHVGCYVTVCVLIAKKMRLPLKNCDVKVEASKSDEIGTIAEEIFEITFNIDAPKEKIQKLHEITLKNCPVGILFERAGVKITYHIKIKA